MATNIIDHIFERPDRECRAILMVGGGSVAAVEFRGTGISSYRLVHDDVLNGGAASIHVAMRQDTSAEWLELAMPQLLASDRVDAMTRLRLAARWAEAKGA